MVSVLIDIGYYAIKGVYNLGSFVVYGFAETEDTKLKRIVGEGVKSESEDILRRMELLILERDNPLPTWCSALNSDFENEMIIMGLAIESTTQ